MSSSEAPTPAPRTGIGLVGAGAMGAFHARTLARHLPDARLAHVADADAGLAEQVASSLGCARWSTDPAALLADSEVEGVVIAAPARFHADLIEAACRAGRPVFCEKPIADDLDQADRAIAAARAAGVPLQIGFQRRFDPAYRAARDLLDRGELGQVQLLRSITRDPRLERPERVPAWAVFRETLIHDFDVLRFFNPGARAVEVFAWADALVRPDWKSRGLLDSAVAVVRFDNGAMATVDASFQTAYGYDVRAEVFGSGGMASVGDGRRSDLVRYGPAGATSERHDWFADLFRTAYIAELEHFVQRVRDRATPACTGEDGRAALAMALAAIESVQSGRPAAVADA